MIRLSSEQVTAIRRHGAGEYPLECCGVLLGDVVNGAKVVREVRRLENTFEPSADFERSVAGGEAEASVGQERRFMISPEVMFALMQEERRTKRKVLGFYHSHPDHPARPSEYDRAWAMPWYSYLIISVEHGEPAELTSWTLADDGSRFADEQIDHTS